MAADFAAAKVVLPARTDEVTSDYTLHGKNIRPAHEHGSTMEAFCLLNSFRHSPRVDCNEMIRDNVCELFKPELRKGSQHFALLCNSCRQDAIEGGNSISSD